VSVAPLPGRISSRKRERERERGLPVGGRDTRFESRPKFPPQFRSPRKPPSSRRSFTSESPHYCGGTMLAVFARRINYLTNNCSRDVLYVLAVNFTSKRFAGATSARAARRALFVDSIKPPALPIFLEERIQCGFYDRRNPAARTMRAHDNAPALATGTPRAPRRRQHPDYTTTHFGGS